jgi:LPS export ABC transporter protein LptC
MASSVYIRPLLALVVMAAIAGMATVVFRSGSRGSEPVRSVNQQLPKNIDVALQNARFLEIQEGIVLWELIADRVDYDKDGDTASLSKIRMSFPPTRTRGTVVVTADSGDYNSVAKAVKLNGHVHVVTEEGASFNTESIVYSGSSAQFSTADPVVFRHERMRLNAVGMDMGVNDQKARFHSGINASVVAK